MSDCLIITAVAREFADEIERIAGDTIRVTTCISAREARDRYSGETAIFGNPEMIAEILPDLPAVNWVQSSWAGVTPLIELDRRDYVLTGVKGVFGPQMSDYVIAWLLAHETKLLQRQAAQQRREWLSTLSGTIRGKQIGIMGTGSIGRHIAQTAGQFDMKVTGLNRSGAATAGFGSVTTTDRLPEFLGSLDYLVCTLPSTPASTGLLSATTLAYLPAHAYVINVGRSNVIDHDALVTALHNGKLGGAALDVFDTEPLPADSPLWDTPNLSITAHIAAVSHPLLIVPVFVDNFRRYASGQPLANQVDFAAGY
jgi:phosphoglycerate dehydrogenase-like enzyme